MISKYFSDCKTADDLKREYKKLVVKLHPDNNHDKDTTREFQEMQAEYTETWNRLKDIHVNAAGETYTKETNETAAEYMDMIDKLIHVPGIVIEVCGSWIWITGNTRPVKDILKSLRFKFSAKKSAWYYHRDPYRKRSKNTLSMDQIREYYGSNQYRSDESQKTLAS